MVALRTGETIQITKLDKLVRIGSHPAEEGNGDLTGLASDFEAPGAAEFLESRQWRKAVAMVYANRGTAYRRKESYDAAIADYTESIRHRR